MTQRIVVDRMGNHRGAAAGVAVIVLLLLLAARHFKLASFSETWSYFQSIVTTLSFSSRPFILLPYLWVFTASVGTFALWLSCRTSFAVFDKEQKQVRFQKGFFGKTRTVEVIPFSKLDVVSSEEYATRTENHVSYSIALTLKVQGERCERILWTGPSLPPDITPRSIGKKMGWHSLGRGWGPHVMSDKFAALLGHVD